MKTVDCTKWYNRLLVSLFKKSYSCKVVSLPPVVVPTPDPIPVSDPAVWPAYRCDKFMQHGTDDENEVREAALDVAQKAGLNTLRCNVGKMNDELAVHLLHFRSPVDNKFKLGSKNWYEKGLKHGVTRYQFVVTQEHAERWAKLVVDYPKDTVQFLADDVDEVRKLITQRPVFKNRR